MKPPDPEGIPRIDVSTEELEALLEQAKQQPLPEEGYHKLKAAIRTLGYVTELLEKKETTLAALRELLCPASTEKTDKVLKQAGIETGEKKPSAESAIEEAEGRDCWARAQWRGCVSRGNQGASAARVVKGGRSVSGRALQRQSLCCSANPACWCGSKGRRRWPRPSMSWKS